MPLVATVGSFLRSVGRQMFLGALAVATAVLGLALLLAALTTGGDAIAMPEFVSRSSDPDNGGPSLVAIGSGRASAPADTATTQLALIEEYGLVPSNSGRDTASGESADIIAGQEAAAAPIIAAITALGVPAGTVRAVKNPTFALPMFGGGGNSGGGVRVDVTLAQPTLERVAEIVRAAAIAAREDGTSLSQVGVGYTLADCGPLHLEARWLATENARAQALQQAEVLEADLGVMRLSSDVVSTEAEPRLTVVGCASSVDTDAINQPYYGYGYGPVPITVPPYDATLPAQASVEVQVSLTYELGAP